MLQLKIYDSDGIELNEGDLLRIHSGNSNVFYTHLLFKEGYIHPLDNFCFRKIYKCDKVPENALESRSDVLDKHWYFRDPDNTPIDDSCGYSMSWITFQSIRKDAIYRITKVESKPVQQKLF